MTEFRTTATHDGRAVPMPEVNAATCDGKTLSSLHNAYCGRNTWDAIDDAGYNVDVSDFRDRVAADARASAAPSEDAIRAAKFEALIDYAATVGKFVPNVGGTLVSSENIADYARKHYAPRPVYAAPVALSAFGGVFGQTGPDEFTHWAASGTPSRFSGHYWRTLARFSPADGALVLAVLDGAERAK